MGLLKSIAFVRDHWSNEKLQVEYTFHHDVITHKQECNYIQVHKVSLQRSLVWGDGPGDGPKSEMTICMSAGQNRSIKTSSI